MNKNVKIVSLVIVGVLGITLGAVAKRPAIMLIPAFLLGKAYRIYKKGEYEDAKKWK